MRQQPGGELLRRLQPLPPKPLRVIQHRPFAGYVQSRGKLKQFRSEAVRAGFADAYRRGDFATIVTLAERLPESVLQEDPDLLMYYDNASLRVG